MHGRHRALSDERGSAFTEYVVLFGFLGLVVAVAMKTRTETLAVDFANAVDLVLLPSF